MTKLLNDDKVLASEEEDAPPNPWVSFTTEGLILTDLKPLLLLVETGFVTTSFESCDPNVPDTRSILQGFMCKSQKSKVKQIMQDNDCFAWVCDYAFQESKGIRAHGLQRFPNTIPHKDMLVPRQQRIWLNKEAGTGFNFGAEYLYTSATNAAMALMPASQRMLQREACFFNIVSSKCQDIAALLVENFDDAKLT